MYRTLHLTGPGVVRLMDSQKNTGRVYSDLGEFSTTSSNFVFDKLSELL